MPSAARRAEEVYAELTRAAPADGRPLFCQGDFLPGQVLCHASGWSVIDFDDSRYADPLSEVAAMYAAMPRELGKRLMKGRVAPEETQAVLERLSRREDVSPS